jgi:hypothetical protein
MGSVILPDLPNVKVGGLDELSGGFMFKNPKPGAPLVEGAAEAAAAENEVGAAKPEEAG